MRHLYITAAALDSTEFIGAEPLDRATWVCLLRLAALLQTGGRIPDCKTWGDRRWQQQARVTLAEVQRACGLWSWDGADLVVAHYPLEAEASFQRAVARSKLAAEARWKRAPIPGQPAPQAPPAAPAPAAVPAAPPMVPAAPPVQGPPQPAQSQVPPADSQAGKLDRFRRLLARSRFASDPTALEEWAGLAKDSGVRSLDEAAEFLRAMKAHQAANGLASRWAKDYEAAAKSWARKRRQAAQAAP